MGDGAGAFAARAGVFHHNHTMVQPCRVVRLKHVVKSGVQRCAYICRKAFACGQHPFHVSPLPLGKVGQVMQQVIGIQAGIAL